MPPRTYLGDFEHLVMLALLHLGGAGYGMQVRREIETRTGRDVAIGAVYATLDRLAGKGLLRSSVAAGSDGRAGRGRRTFVVSAAGRRALEDTRDVIGRMSSGLYPEPGSS